MAHLRASFEQELKNKLSQKSTALQSEEGVLKRNFKYFDLNNDGTCQLAEWCKAIEKIGVVVPSLDDLKALFHIYDVDGSGALDYNEFAAIVMQGKPMQASPAKAGGAATSMSKINEAEEMIEKIRNKLASRGARGIIGLGRSFRIMDDDNSRNLDFYEFKKSLTDYKLGFTTHELKILFDAFDVNDDQTVDYDEFLRIVRGKMSQKKLKIVHQAFAKIDKDGSGVIDMKDIEETYNAKQHPDVIQGKKTEEEVLMEFLETFESHHNVMMNKPADYSVTMEEFEEYYANIAASCPNDEYFELMMTNAWKLGEAGKTYEKGWASPDKAVRPVGSPKQASRKDVAHYTYSSAGNVLNLGSKLAIQKEQEKKSEPPPYKGPARDIEETLTKFRAKLASRGTRGIIGIGRQFKIMDDNRNHTLEFPEFRKAVVDYRVGLTEKEIDELFKAFDRSGDGVVDYDELLRNIRGPMNPFRTNLVDLAYKKLDRTGDGQVDIQDIKGVYNAKNHPDVKDGKKTEDEVLGEFLETFEMHHNLKGGMRDQIITTEEFHEYYNNVSASIDNDQYFELMMTNAWKLFGEPQYANKKAWAGEVGTSPARKPGGPQASAKPTHKTAPFGVTEHPTDYSTSQKPKSVTTTKVVYEESKGAAGSAGTAGYPSYPDYEAGKQSAPPMKPPAGPKVTRQDEELLEHFREVINKRGARGILGLSRRFKIVDDDGSMDLNMYEFNKSLHDCRLKFNEEETKRLFKIFDRDNSGSIDYDEFLRAVHGEMNKFRVNLCMKAFNILDKDGSGHLDIEDIKGVYNAAKHPDVIQGKKTEDDVLTEFLDTFEMHYSYNHPGAKDSKITKEEFIEYYTNVSMSIDNDAYFELMMNNAWNLDKSRVTRKGWAGEIQWPKPSYILFSLISQYFNTII